MKLGLYRLTVRIINFYNRHWWFTYSITAVLIVFIIWISLEHFLSIEIKKINFQDLATLSGTIAVFIVATRQHKDSLFQARTNQIPYVVRYAEFGFEWNKSILYINHDPSKGINNALGIKILNGIHISNIRGYILYEGYFYPLLFSTKYNIASATYDYNEVQTWIDSDKPVYILPVIDKKIKIKYPGNYYCIIFESPLGDKYFLEEDHSYKMKQILLNEERPKWERDYLFDYILNN